MDAGQGPHLGTGESPVEGWVRDFRLDPRRAGFLLDFDGTLSPIAPTPDEARALPGAAGILEALADRYRLVAIVSGRRADDVRALIPAAGVRYLGLYGAEEAVGGATEANARAMRPAVVVSLVAKAQAFVEEEGLSGCEVEDKGRSVALHYRRAAPEAGDRLAEWAVAEAEDLGLELRPGRMVVELTPPGPTKAEAVDGLIRREGLRLAVVAGDDVADVGSLRRAGELLGPGALRIGVTSEEGPPELAGVSDVRVPGPGGVLALLSRFV
jgi:trehalose 6-phosphate phosphatase